MVQVSSYAVGLMALMAASYGVAMPSDILERSVNEVSGPHCLPKDGRKGCFPPQSLEASEEDLSEYAKFGKCTFNAATAKACCKTPFGTKCGKLPALRDEQVSLEESYDLAAQGKWWDAFKEKCTINWAEKSVCCKLKYGTICGALNGPAPSGLRTELELESNVEAELEAEAEVEEMMEMMEEAEASPAFEIVDETPVDLQGKWWSGFKKFCSFEWSNKRVCCKIKMVHVCGGLNSEMNAMDFDTYETEEDALTVDSLTYNDLEAMLYDGDAEGIAAAYPAWAKKAEYLSNKALEIAAKAEQLANADAEEQPFSLTEIESMLQEGDLQQLAGKWSKWAKKAAKAAKKAAAAAKKARDVYCKLYPEKCGVGSDTQLFSDADIQEEYEFLTKMNWKRWAKRAARGYCLVQTYSPACLAAAAAAPEYFEGSSASGLMANVNFAEVEETMAKSLSAPTWDNLGSWAKSSAASYCNFSNAGDGACQLMAGVDTDSVSIEQINQIASLSLETALVFEQGTMITEDEDNFDFTEVDADQERADEMFEASAQTFEELEAEAATEKLQSEEAFLGVFNNTVGSAEGGLNVAYLYAMIGAGVLLMGVVGGVVFKKVADKTSAKNSYSATDDKKADLLDNYQDVADVAEAPVTMV